MRQWPPKKKDAGNDPTTGRAFKRQSYHVAIAYKVYMHWHKIGLRPNHDPTLFARQLKQQDPKN